MLRKPLAHNVFQRHRLVRDKHQIDWRLGATPIFICCSRPYSDRPRYDDVSIVEREKRSLSWSYGRAALAHLPSGGSFRLCVVRPLLPGSHLPRALVGRVGPRSALVRGVCRKAVRAGGESNPAPGHRTCAAIPSRRGGLGRRPNPNRPGPQQTENRCAGNLSTARGRAPTPLLKCVNKKFL